MTTVRRPTIRLGYVLELVATAAVCFAVVRSQLSWAWSTAALPAPGSGWVRLFGGSILTGMAIAGGVGLAVETIRGRRPASWGLGRWAWSIAGLFMIFYVAEQFVGLGLGRLRWQQGPSSFGLLARRVFERSAIHQFFGGFGWAIAAVCATSLLAGSPRDPEPDAREWAGRIFASLAVALNIAEPLLRAAGP